ncbi:prolyl oligopeptidase [Chytridium lagenaria]|nr:prolyl oligopeptidase [Chytridium lagenaria]
MERTALTEFRDETHAETLHGVQVKDPFRVLEDPDHATTKKFLFTNFERFGCPFNRGNSVYYFHNSGLQAQSVLYEQKSPAAEPEVFLDPNSFSEDGTVSLNSLEFSKSGALCAFGVSISGSDWVTIRVKGPDNFGRTKKKKAKFTGIAWTHDEKGFFYSRYPKPENVTRDNAGTETAQSQNMMLVYHRIGTAQSQDLLILEDKVNPDLLFGSEISDDGKYLIVTISKNCDPQNLVYISKVDEMGLLSDKAQVDFNKIIDKWDAEFSYLTNEGTVFFFRTTLNAPKRRIVKYDLLHPEKGFEEIIAEKEDVIEFCNLADENKLILVSCNTYNFGSKTNEVYKTTKLSDFDPSDVDVEQVFYPSADGTKIPMYILSNKNVDKNIPKPTLLYGYGGFNISIKPAFSLSWMPLQTLGEVENTAKTGTMTAAQWLIDHKYTSPRHLPSTEDLTEACVNQRPDLFGAVVGDVGVMDLLRFHKFTIGSAWTSDYGDPDKEDDFRYLLKISPVHNVRKDVKYPAILLTTSDHDDRCSSSFFKVDRHPSMEAKSDFPILIRVDTKSGHGAGKSTQQVIEETVDKLAFMSEILGCEFKANL